MSSGIGALNMRCSGSSPGGYLCRNKRRLLASQLCLSVGNPCLGSNGLILDSGGLVHLVLVDGCGFSSALSVIAVPLTVPPGPPWSSSSSLPLLSSDSPSYSLDSEVGSLSSSEVACEKATE